MGQPPKLPIKIAARDAAHRAEMALLEALVELKKETLKEEDRTLGGVALHPDRSPDHLKAQVEDAWGDEDDDLLSTAESYHHLKKAVQTLKAISEHGASLPPEKIDVLGHVIHLLNYGYIESEVSPHSVRDVGTNPTVLNFVEMHEKELMEIVLKEARRKSRSAEQMASITSQITNFEGRLQNNNLAVGAF